MTDDITGLDYMEVNLQSPKDTWAGSGGQLVEGTKLDGYYEGDITIPMAAAAGEWKVYNVYMRDEVTNSQHIYTDSLAARGLPTSITVTVSGSDSSVSTSVNSGVATGTPVGTGEDHTCGVTATGEAYCSRDNAVKQRGNGTTTDSSVPVKVGGNW
ncbi:MAG: hypothetical protein CME14_05215 [Gemmatimonadetes bacterium]|nr:hypothetical protein [Gemmatimonadota bacterium]